MASKVGTKLEDRLLEFLSNTPEEDQDPVKFFAWAQYPSSREGHACAVWKTTAARLPAEKAIALQTAWVNSKEARKEYWDKLRKKEEASRKMEEWCLTLQEANTEEKTAVVKYQKNCFLKFVDDKNSPFVVEDGAPYIPPKRKRSRESPTDESEASSQVLASGDVVEALQDMLPDQEMGKVLNIKRKETFNCMVKEQDVGRPFTQYFDLCRSEGYKHSYPEDALALSATLLIKRNTRSPLLLKAFRGKQLTHLADCFLESLAPTSHCSLLEKQQALISKWISWIRFEPASKKDNAAKRMDIMDRLHNDWGKAKELELGTFHCFFATSVLGLFTEQPLDFQESDGIASFIRNLLTAILQEVDLVRFSCADKGSEASRYHKAINDLKGQSKQPDMVGVLSHEDVKVETFFGEASSVCTHNSAKYSGDTIRLGVFGKNSSDMISNPTDLSTPILLFNTDGMVLQAFVLGKEQDIYPMIEIGTARIPSSINDLLFLAQDWPFWMRLRRIARKTSQAIENAVEEGQVDHERRKHFFPTIATPAARAALRAAAK